MRYTRRIKYQMPIQIIQLIHLKNEFFVHKKKTFQSGGRFVEEGLRIEINGKTCQINIFRLLDLSALSQSHCKKRYYVKQQQQKNNYFYEFSIAYKIFDLSEKCLFGDKAGLNPLYVHMQELSECLVNCSNRGKVSGCRRFARHWLKKVALDL